MSEQDLIEKYFSRHQNAAGTVELSVGDDAAIVNPPSNSKLVITTDTLNVGAHFYHDCKAEYIGHKAIAVSLSDIAAMGAIPLWATISLSLPNVDHAWLKDFSAGLYALADTHDLKIVGGDLVKGPLSITVQVIGSLTDDQKLLRNACQAGDLIYVSGHLGDAAYGLKLIQNSGLLENNKKRDYFLSKINVPKPRLDISPYIVKFAHAAIDVSDGFLIDLKRILTMSKMAAEIELNKIPISEAMQEEIQQPDDIKDLLLGGEDYELIFTIDPEDKEILENYFHSNNIMISEVGRVTEGSGIALFYQGVPTDMPTELGFDHFS